MIRTKYLFVGVCGVIIMASVLGLRADNTIVEQTVSKKEALFTSPKDVYEVVTHTATDKSLERSTFIASVRSALLRDLSEKKKEPDIIPEESIEVVTTPSTLPLYIEEAYGEASATTTAITNTTDLSLEYPSTTTASISVSQ